MSTISGISSNMSTAGSMSSLSSSSSSTTSGRQLSTISAISSLSNISGFNSDAHQPAKTHKPKEINVYDKIEEIDPGLLETTRKSLENFSRKHQVSQASEDLLNRSPRVEYAHEVCHALSYYLLVQLKQKTIFAVELREEFENMFYLIRFFEKQRKDVSAAIALSELVVQLIFIMEILILYSERLSSLPTTKWSKVRFQMSRQFSKASDAVEVKMPYDLTPFVLDRILGVGGFGAVQRARFGSAILCVKFVSRKNNPLKYSFIDRMVASMINHPFVAQYYTSFVTMEAYVTVMEYIRGVDVTRVLKLVYMFPEDVCQVIIAQLGVALQHMHYKGFAHRDVKPANMMILPGCRIKLIDFDTARVGTGRFHVIKLVSYFKKTAMEWQQTDFSGTLPYIAPEGIKRKGYGRALDWWAVGVTLYELATGRLPFFEHKMEELKNLIIKGEFTWPKIKIFPPNLVELVDALLQKEPAERLCSENYQHWFDHNFFHNLNWKWLDTADCVKEYGPILASINPTSSPTAVLSPVSSPKLDEKFKKHFGSQTYTTPCPFEEQPKILLFASAGFQRAYDKFLKGETISINDMKEDVDFQFRCKGEGYTFKDHLFKVDDSGVWLFLRRAKNLLAWQSFGFKVTETVHGGTTYLTVNLVEPGSIADKAGVCVLDLVITMNSMNCVGMSLMEFIKRIKECEETLDLKVSKLNPYRLIKQKGAVDFSRVTPGEIRVELKRTSKSSSDLGFRTVSVYTEGKPPRGGVSYIIVCEVLSSMRISKYEGSMPTILVGDCILQINQTAVSTDNHKEIFQGIQRFADVIFVPTSAIRRDYVRILWSVILGTRDVFRKQEPRKSK